MNYIIIAGIIIVLFIIYTVVSTSNGVKKAPEKLSNARRLFSNGDSNAALRELGKSFVLPMGDKITPEYNKHLLAVLALLKEILDGMNISSDNLIPKLQKRLSEATKTIELQENLYKPVQEFFENTESDEKLVAYLRQAALSGSIGVIASDNDSSAPRTSDRTTEYVNRAGKFALKGEPKKGIEVYEEALSHKWEQHDEAFLYDQLGSFHLMNKDLAAAETNYKKSISIEPYFTNVWNYCDFLAYHKRIEDAKAQLPLLTSVMRTKSDQKEYDSLFKKFPDLK